MTLQTIQFGDEGQVATRELVRAFETLLERQPQLDGGPLRGHFRTLEAIDRQYGGSAPLPLEDAAELVAAVLSELARLDHEAGRDRLPGARDGLADLVLGTALWATRHGVAIEVPEPVANALALRSNRAATRQELAAVFGLMQGVIAHVSARLSPDLERSNPERPWRILHANLAITAIRTEDPVLMDFAFDALDAALPDERAGFYAEALALALAPGIAPEVRDRIEARHRKWTRS